MAIRRFHYELIESTNSAARELASAFPGEHLLVTAARQSAGRGRQGRVWQSPLGGAWMSIAWPTNREPRHYAPVALAMAVAARRALLEVVDDATPEFHIKWPNDLLIESRKVAGILCEQVPVGSDDRRRVLIIGIGVNVDFEPSLFGADLRQPATTLRAALNRSLDVENVVEAVSRHVADAMHTFEREGLSRTVLAELDAHLAYVGTVRSWTSPRGDVSGRVLGVDDIGRLVMENETGRFSCEVGEFTE